MKHTQFFIFIVFLLSSCPDTVLHTSDYYKAFFLEEDFVTIDGAVFDVF